MGTTGGGSCGATGVVAALKCGILPFAGSAMKGVARAFTANPNSPGRPGRTGPGRSVVHQRGGQRAPVSGGRHRAAGSCGSRVIWASAIASLLSQSRSYPSPEEVAAAPVRPGLTWGMRSHSSSGPSPPARISRSVFQNSLWADWEAPRHRCLFAGSCDPCSLLHAPPWPEWPRWTTADWNRRPDACSPPGKPDQGGDDSFAAGSGD